jgi:hypothetical protein
MNTPLCQLITMPIVKHVLKIDALKMEQAFQMGYRQGEKVFFVSPTNWQSEEISIQLLSNYGVFFGRIRMIDLRSSCKGPRS